MFNEDGIFCRTDMPIRMLAVHKYVETGEISNLWWRMQYGKLWFNWGANGYPVEQFVEYIENQKRRLIDITTIFMNGKGHKLGPIILGKNRALIDGAHRLSCYIYFNIDNVPVNYSEKIGCKQGKEDALIREWYNDSECAIINLYKARLITLAEGEEWMSPKSIGKIFEDV